MYVHVCACMCKYRHVFVGMCRYLIYVLSCAWKVMHLQCWDLIAEKSTQQKTRKSQQNGFDCSGARTPVIRCTIGTMYHWVSKAGQIKEMMEYIPHVSRYIPTYTYTYLYIHAHICIYLHIHAHTCTYPTPQLETAISQQPVSRSTRAKEQIE